MPNASVNVKQKLIKSRRRLDELYREGVEIRVGRDADGKRWTKIADKGEGPILDEDGTPVPLGEDDVAMWVQPPNPLQREMALRAGNAARAVARVAAKRDPESVEHSTIMAFLSDMSDETLVEYVLVNDLDQRRQDAMREVLGSEEWAEVTALQDAVRKMEERQAAEPDWDYENDPEYKALEAEQDRFGEQVTEREQELREANHDVLKMMPRGAVEKQALDKRVEIVCSQAFMYEYEQHMSWYSVRDVDDHDELFFESPREFANQHDEVQDLIRRALEPFITDGGEAKNLLGVASGSESSEPPSKPETSDPSIPQESIE